MDQLKPPSELCFDGDIACAWKKWKQQLKIFMTATQSDEKDDKIKTCILLSCTGSNDVKCTGPLLLLNLMKRKSLMSSLICSIRIANQRKI